MVVGPNGVPIFTVLNRGGGGLKPCDSMPWTGTARPQAPVGLDPTEGDAGGPWY